MGASHSRSAAAKSKAPVMACDSANPMPFGSAPHMTERVQKNLSDWINSTEACNLQDEAALRKDKMVKVVKTLLLLKYLKHDNEPIEVIKGLYIGSIGAAHNRPALKENNITHVLTAARGLPTPFPEDFEYQSIEVLDKADVDISVHFPAAFKHIDEGIRRGGCLVHCFAGKSRSTTIVAAYLMATKGYSTDLAIDIIKSKRPVVDPNPGFRMQLVAFHKLLQQQQQQQQQSPVGSFAQHPAVANGPAASGL